MRTNTIPAILLGLVLPVAAGVAPKTNSSQPVDLDLLDQEPYRFNGLVFSGPYRGSGFVAGSPNLFFTAAHVVFDEEGWSAPPSWVGGYSGEGEPPVEDFIMARGYFRWTQYANLVAQHGQNSRAAFGRDIAMAWSFEPFIEGDPANLDYKGVSSLKKGNLSMITGYPAELDYTNTSGGHFLHSTNPDEIPYRGGSGRYVYATHISTGPGNSGGPVWSWNGEVWSTAGVLVAGRPSETGVYAMSPDVKSLMRAAAPVLKTPAGSMKFVRSVSASSILLSQPKAKKIPDGRTRWTRIPLSVLRFPEDSTVSRVTLNLTITTGHRGDLVVGLLGPGGAFKMIHNGEDADADDLVIDDMDLSDAFSGNLPNGRWQLMVQDRLKGDLAVVTRFQLEIEAE